MLSYTRGGYPVPAARPHSTTFLEDCTMTQLKIDISGMTCGHCVGSVTRALKGLDGVAVEQVTVGKATVSYDATATSPATIAAAIEDEGYRVVSAS